MLRTYNTARNNICLSVDFLVIIIHRYFLYAKKKKLIQFSLWRFVLNLFCLYSIFIILIVLPAFSIIFKFSFSLNLITVSLFHLNWKISFGFLSIKENLLRLFELASKMQEIWPCIEQAMLSVT